MNEHQRKLLLLDLPNELVGERVILRPFWTGDGPALWEATEESREHLGRWLEFVQYNTQPNHSEEYARGCHASWILRERFAMGVRHRETSRLLGQCLLVRPDWSIPSFEMGYWLRASAEGHGYMSEAAQLMTRFAFELLGVQRLHIRCNVRNTRSAAVPRGLGFVQEGILRNHACGTSDELYDEMVFGMLLEDYDRVRASEMQTKGGSSTGQG